MFVRTKYEPFPLETCVVNVAMNKTLSLWDMIGSCCKQASPFPYGKWLGVVADDKPISFPIGHDWKLLSMRSKSLCLWDMIESCCKQASPFPYGKWLGVVVRDMQVSFPMRHDWKLFWWTNEILSQWDKFVACCYVSMIYVWNLMPGTSCSPSLWYMPWISRSCILIMYVGHC